MDEERIIAEVAKRNGVLLHRGDPVLQIHTMLDLHTADHQEREERLAQRDADLVARLSQVLEQAKAQAGGQLANTVAAELPRAIKLAVLQRFRWWAVLGGGALVLAVAAGFGAGWWLGSSTEVERYANLPAEFNVAMSNHDAARWLDMMRKNPHGAFDRCTDVPQAAGKACSFVLWTEPGKAAQ